MAIPVEGQEVGRGVIGGTGMARAVAGAVGVTETFSATLSAKTR
jgi:hypothetical protein